MMVIATVMITTVVITLLMCSYPHQERKYKEATLSELVLIVCENYVKKNLTFISIANDAQVIPPQRILTDNYCWFLFFFGLGIIIFSSLLNLGSLTMFVVRSTNVNGSSLMVTLTQNGLRISTVYWTRTSYSPCPMENVLAYHQM